MTEFDELRDQLSGSRREIEQARQAALLAREAAKQAERVLQKYTRIKGSLRDEERDRLEAELKRAQARAEQAEGLLSDMRINEGGLWEQFRDFTDPRQGLRAWSDSHPILLFPLRLETRFKTGVNGQPQLWVRVFPDTCLVDTFEEALTEQEITNAQLFWAGIWRAGGDEALERAAWRDLVAAHGSGRAGWIVQRYQPINPEDKKDKDNETDVLLIVTSPRPLSAAVNTYWEAFWRAVDATGAIDQPARDVAYADLEQAVGQADAREIVENFRPFNINDEPSPPLTRADVTVKVLVLQLTPLTELEARRTSWSSAPRVELLPDRFVLVGYWAGGDPLIAIGNPIHTPLIAGPDPNAPDEQQLKPVEDKLQIPDDMAWMFNFERALEVGMALRVDLNPQQAANGFTRVVVLGLRLSDSSDQGRQNLSHLLDHHLHSRTGLELLPQGTPTNNTEKGGAGYSFRNNPDASFGPFFRKELQYSPESEPLLRRDGQWLADMLGLPPDQVQHLPNAGGTDQLEARAMQIALWPGTLGYMMKTLLSPVFSEADIAGTRFFFTRYVSGRGPLPALRIGDQPYGIYPTTDFRRINWFGRKENFLSRLYEVLRRIEDDWRPLAGAVSYIGKTVDDPHQALLDVLGLHSGSVEYYPLQAESVDHKFYELSFLNFSFALEFLGLFPAVLPLTLLRSFGYTGTEVPDLLNKVYKARQTPLTGPLIDDRPLSEIDGIRNYAGQRNYIQWLVYAAQAGIEQVQQEQGFDGDKKPAALLYLLLRHALQLSFHVTGVRLEAEGGLVTDTRAMLREPAFVHVRETQGSESRYDSLFRTAEAITGEPNLLLGDYIARNIRQVDPDLGEQIAALERLSSVSTARLERVFAEHIDTASYRLDAWKTGLLTWQLERMREAEKPVETEVAAEVGPGLYLGAYGWLEPLQPEDKGLSPVELPEDLETEINKHDKTPLMRDSSNQGLIHAPSINHATTAAVLRNGYLSNDGRLAVNLTSRRVRLALGILEGMRGGQSLGELLGYQFERHVHDNGPLEVHDLVYHMRRAFPLVANQIQKTKTEEGEAKESIAAMNVVDGRKLVEYVEKEQNFAYPFGLTTLPSRPANQEGAITSAVTYIRDINDAVADLVLAEGVHQAVVGNYDRSAGTLDAFAKGGYPPEPEVIQTPRSGIALTLRTAIHLPPAPPANPLPAIPLTPLAGAEPALNAWLRERLPTPALVGCQVSFTDRSTNSSRTEFIDQVKLGLHPIDLLYRIDTSEKQALNDLDDRILQYLHTRFAPRHDRPIMILYTERVAGNVTWFELQALLRSLRELTIASRPLQPADLMRANDTNRDEQVTMTLPRSRVENARDDLHDVRIPALDTLSESLADPAVTIDDGLTQFAGEVGRLAAYHLPQTGTGFVYEWRAATYSALVDKIAARIKQWHERLVRYKARIDDYDLHLDPATSESDRIALLQAAEAIISAELTEMDPPDPVAYRSALNTRQSDFEGKLDKLQKLLDNARATLTQFLADAKAELHLEDFDLEPFDLTDTEAEIDRFRTTLIETTKLLKEDLLKRIARVDALLLQHTTASSATMVKLLQEAGKILFGEDFVMVPQITLAPRAADELANAWQHTSSGKLTAYLTGDPTADPPGVGRDFPVDDWLHGVARVREKMRHWENAILLSGALPGAQSPELTPLQLPYGAEEPWLALEIPAKYKIDSERLLYSAHFASPFDKTQPVCGLLVDEWAEVIPGIEETTGVAFHYDRPNSEPPQTWLLALPAVRDGAWSWEELLAAVNEALDSAKIRAVEPTHIDSTAYSAFLPATVSAYTFPEISISNNLLRNVQVYARLIVNE